MFPDLNFVDCVMILLGALFLVKKVAEMERHHDLRVILLTSISGVILALLFIWFSSAFGDHYQDDCIHCDYFTESEM